MLVACSAHPLCATRVVLPAALVAADVTDVCCATCPATVRCACAGGQGLCGRPASLRCGPSCGDDASGGALAARWWSVLQPALLTPMLLHTASTAARPSAFHTGSSGSNSYSLKACDLQVTACCQRRQLALRFRRALIPADVEPAFTGCVLCDARVLRLVATCGAARLPTGERLARPGMSCKPAHTVCPRLS